MPFALRQRLAPVLLAALAAGCAVGPDLPATMESGADFEGARLLRAKKVSGQLLAHSRTCKELP